MLNRANEHDVAEKRNGPPHLANDYIIVNPTTPDSGKWAANRDDDERVSTYFKVGR